MNFIEPRSPGFASVKKLPSGYLAQAILCYDAMRAVSGLLSGRLTIPDTLYRGILTIGLTAGNPAIFPPPRKSNFRVQKCVNEIKTAAGSVKIPPPPPSLFPAATRLRRRGGHRTPVQRVRSKLQSPSWYQPHLKGISMDEILRKSVWQQYGAAIDTLDDALMLCPDSLWTGILWHDADDARYGQVWYIAYHALSWTDLFLGGTMEGFAPPPPFIRGKLPEQPYPKEAVRGYLQHCRQKSQAIFAALTDDQAWQVCKFAWMEPTYLELQLYSLRHLQEHAAQLNMFLGQQGVTGQDWVPKARENAS
jgi:hypothetical protein